MMAARQGSVLALTGGVGGAKLALGLADSLDPGQLHVAVNTGDDFNHLGLLICPDIDTLLYTLSGLSNQQLGWGVADESWQVMEALQKIGGDTWFRLGDRDLATHLWRAGQLAGGASLSELTGMLARQWNVGSFIHPMSDFPVRTVVECDTGDLLFQHYFVREQCGPSVSGFRFEGIADATPNPELLALLQGDDLSAIVVCPSNPYVSIDPILQLPAMWQALAGSPAPLVLVSPIVGGQAIKGPAAKMMAELGVPVTAKGVAQHYCSRYPGLLDYFVIDHSDATLAAEIEDMGLHVAVTNTVMKSRADKQQLAQFTLDLVTG